MAKLKSPEFRAGNSKHSTYLMDIDHTCYDVFYVFSGNTVYKKELNEFLLETDYFEKKPNINYAANKRSVLNKAKGLAEHEIEMYNRRTKKGAQ